MPIRGIPGLEIVRTIAKISHSIFSDQKLLRHKGALYGLPYDSAFARTRISIVEQNKVSKDDIKTVSEKLVTAQLFKAFSPHDIRQLAENYLYHFGPERANAGLEHFGREFIKPGFSHSYASIQSGILDILESSISDRFFSRNEIDAVFQKEIIEGTAAGIAFVKSGGSLSNFKFDSLSHFVNNFLGGLLIPMEVGTFKEDLEDNKTTMRQLKIVEDWLYYHPEILKTLFT